MLIYDETHKDVTLEWVEEKNNNKLEPHILRRKPVLCQLDPVKKGIVIRVHFSGKKPAWIDRYIIGKNGRHYTVQEVRTKNGVGFTMTDKQANTLPCPFIKGMIEEWFESVDEKFYSFKDRLLENLAIVEKNLYHYSELFSDFGLYFKREEVEGKYGALWIDKNKLAPTEDWEGSLFDFERCIDSLLEIREYPIEEELLDDELVEEVLELPKPEELEETKEEILEELLEEPLEESIVELPVFEVQEEYLEDELLQEEAIENEIQELSTSEVLIDEEELVLMEEELSEVILPEVEQLTEVLSVQGNLSIEEIMEEVKVDEGNNTSPIEEITELTELPKKLKVADKSDSKEGIVVGQILLF